MIAIPELSWLEYVLVSVIEIKKFTLGNLLLKL